MARILILGGNGFIGRNLAVSLVNQGFDIVSADRSMSPNTIGIEQRIGNLADTSFVHSLFDNLPYDWVIHLASSLIPSSGYDDFIRERELNITGGFELIRTMLKSGSRKLLFFSSGGVIYGNNGLHINNEEAPLSPMNYYAFSKLAMEQFIQLEARLSGLEYIIVRPSNPYGSGQNLFGRQGLIAVALGKILSGEQLQVWGDGSIVRDYLHISDLVSSINKLVNVKAVNEIINIGSGIGLSVNDVLRTIQQVTGNKLDVQYLPGRQVDVPVNILDIYKIQSITNWKPQIELEEGISSLWNEMLVSSAH
jgi:UDP-glucose 4-epimerase